MIVLVMAISNLVLTQQIYSEETNGAHVHYREPVPLNSCSCGSLRSSKWRACSQAKKSKETRFSCTGTKQG